MLMVVTPREIDQKRILETTMNLSQVAGLPKIHPSNVAQILHTFAPRP